jgi:hypothetical protein
VEARRQLRVRAAAGLVVLALGAVLVLVARGANEAARLPETPPAARAPVAPERVASEPTRVAGSPPGRRSLVGLAGAGEPGGNGLLVVEGDVAGVAWIDDVEAGAVRGFVPVELAAGMHRLEVRTTTGSVRVRVRVDAGILQRVRVAGDRATAGMAERGPTG